MEFQQIIHQYHSALDEFSRGNAGPVKSLFSRRDDVTLANPWGPAVRDWTNVEARLDFASSRFRDGKVTGCDAIAEYVSADLATILEVEHWRAKVSGQDDASSFDLRVTSTFRREGGTWKLVHRHADPISTADPTGPLRYSGTNR